MAKNFSIGLVPAEKQKNGVKYILKIEKHSALGNLFGLTKDDLIELQALINEALKR